jgi:pimeloyl-ACP methyl ester carboxylesterase
LVEADELNLSEFVARLAGATGFDIPRPPGDVTLPLRGVAGDLSRKLLRSSLGSEVQLSVEKRQIVVTIDRSLLMPERSAAWEARVRDLAAQATREAQRRRGYGMHALKSYRPADSRRTTVCLVHGVNSSSGGFVHMVEPLEHAGYGLVVYDYPYNQKLDDSFAVFSRDLRAFRMRNGDRRPWVLVGHSMGALVIRDYVEGPNYGGDVSSLVLIAPVNQGSYLARTQALLQYLDSAKAVGGRRMSDALAQLGDGLGEAAADMSPGSPFLQTLNKRPRRRGVVYHILAGDAGVLTRSARAQIEGRINTVIRQGGILGGLARTTVGNDFSDRLDELTDGSGDGCVSVARTRLEGVEDPVVLHANHAELIRAPLLYPDPGPVACMPQLLRWLGQTVASGSRPD